VTAESDHDGRDESAGLYVGWDELQRRVAPRLGRYRFRALIKGKIDRGGFPPFREEWGGWYWPNVRQWLDSDNEVGTDGFVEYAEDGPENFNAAPKRQARVQAGPPGAAVLDRKAGQARSDGISGSVHRLAAGRR
jgi:hypothetical protein